MENDELSEILTYFRLCSYRDGEYILLEEYEELQGIIKRNKTAHYLEEVRYEYLRGIITEEEYNEICINCLNNIKAKELKRTNKNE